MSITTLKARTKKLITDNDKHGNYDINRRFLIDQLKLLSFYVGIGFFFSFFLPLYLSFAASLCIYLLIHYCVRKIRNSRNSSGLEKLKNLFKPESSPTDTPYNEDHGLRYYCIRCGAQHKQRECPNCGSKMKGIGIWDNYGIQFN